MLRPAGRTLRRTAIRGSTPQFDILPCRNFQPGDRRPNPRGTLASPRTNTVSRHRPVLSTRTWPIAGLSSLCPIMCTGFLATMATRDSTVEFSVSSKTVALGRADFRRHQPDVRDQVWPVTLFNITGSAKAATISRTASKL